jgi:UDP-glucuronate 4-epimerase
MKYLVTGGAGFIGNSLALRLCAEGHEVVVLDNLNDYYDVELKEARLARLPKAVEVVRSDLTDTVALSQIFAKHKFDAIAHLAAQAGVRYSLKHPEQYVASNYVGTFNLLEAARDFGVRQIVYASTSSVYGEDTQAPFIETASADRPISVYAATKRAGELLGYTYHHLHDMHFTALRFFTVYGPWGRPDMAPHIFTDKILKGEQITVYGEGKLERDFTYIDDIIAGFVAALQKPAGYAVYNLGNGTPVVLMDFIRTIEAAAGRSAEIEYAELQPGDVTRTEADITAAVKELGYTPQTKVVDGVAAYVDWHRQYYRI